MTQADINRLLAEVIGQARAIGIPVSRRIDPVVRLNSRASGRFGCCLRTKGGYLIELSERLLDAQEWAVRRTLAHEALHTCRGCANHGERWKEYAQKMNAAYGYEISRTDSCEKLGIPDTSPARYVLVCAKCGARITRSRRSSVVQHPERYRCQCGGELHLLPTQTP